MKAWLGKGPRFVTQGAGDLGERMRRAAEFSLDKEGFQKGDISGSGLPGFG